MSAADEGGPRIPAPAGSRRLARLRQPLVGPNGRPQGRARVPPYRGARPCAQVGLSRREAAPRAPRVWSRPIDKPRRLA